MRSGRVSLVSEQVRKGQHRVFVKAAEPGKGGPYLQTRDEVSFPRWKLNHSTICALRGRIQRLHARKPREPSTLCNLHALDPECQLAESEEQSIYKGVKLVTSPCALLYDPAWFNPRPVGQCQTRKQLTNAIPHA